MRLKFYSVVPINKNTLGYGIPDMVDLSYIWLTCLYRELSARAHHGWLGTILILRPLVGVGWGGVGGGKC